MTKEEYMLASLTKSKKTFDHLVWPFIETARDYVERTYTSKPISPVRKDLLAIWLMRSQTYVKKAGITMEFGSGYSTIVFAYAALQQAEYHVAIEHSFLWRQVTKDMTRVSLSNKQSHTILPSEVKIYPFRGIPYWNYVDKPFLNPYFIYVDGPPLNEKSEICMDALDYQSAECIMVDGRAATVEYFKEFFYNFEIAPEINIFVAQSDVGDAYLNLAKTIRDKRFLED